MSGILHLVATPIGNYADMTFRAVEVLKAADVVVYEERREGERLLRQFGIVRPVEPLNEHNETAATNAVLAHLAAGRNVALVSDCGTPVFSDPGRMLVRRAAERGFRIVPVPGASSLLPALTASGFPIDRFLFYGWLSPKKDRRRAELTGLLRVQETIVLMDTPYRLLPLLRDLAAVFGDARRVCVALNLTMPGETFLRGTAAELSRRLDASGLKGEFVVVIEGRGAPARGRTA